MTADKLSVKLGNSIMTRVPELSKDEDNHGNWAYGHGVVLMGIQCLYEQTGDLKYFNYIKKNIDPFIQKDGDILTYCIEDYNIDHINNGKLLFLLEDETKEEKYFLAAKKLYSQLEKQPTTSEGAYWHKKIYPDQIWLDGLYMGTPFLAQWAKKNNSLKDYDKVKQQFTISYCHLKDEKTGLLYHAWDERKVQFWAGANGCSKNFWTRSIGWYVMSIVDTYELLKDDTDVIYLSEYLNEILNSLIHFQDEKTGVWYQVTNEINHPQNYLEASGSAMIVYAIAKGMRLGILERKHWLKILEKSFQGLQQQFILPDDKGLLNVNFTCRVAGLGGGNTQRRDGSLAYYLSEPIVCNDHKGYGAMILAAVEAEEQLNKGRYDE